MICPKCGAKNIDGSTFCIKCGTNLKELPAMNNNINTAPINEYEQTNNVEYQPMNNQSPINNNQTMIKEQVMTQPSQPNINNVNKVSLNYLMYIIAILLKPTKCFKEEETKLNNSKVAVILAVLVSGIMTIANMVKTIFNTVRVGSYSWTEGYTYSWQWDNLKNIKWVELIGKNFLIYAGIILAITIVFYIGSLIAKKQLSFIKSLSISATSIIPAVVGIMILSPIAGMIWSPLSIVFMIIGAVYTIVILYELMNNELKLDGDAKIYFNLICLSILIVAGYYVYMKMFMSSISGGLENILDMFK